ncbi:HYR domain-containing protein [Constantimarinum furrinae]|uniref:HYR domain-containing protein n=1 Tax=Constantimarinum furrinae TaxID=2562285 RepID=A0A7G8PVC0_9FLAO|nr:HYR domain-containing protein [Constantimarinum furrinae]QNJ98286.1 hypothetical protein ALE3EI_1735 [Constantimarinum furrinae]
MKKITLTNHRLSLACMLFLGLTLFWQGELFAQCTPTAGFPDPPGAISCNFPGGQADALFTETFDGGFGVFTEDSPPGPGTSGSNDLTVSTGGDTPSGGTGAECNPEGTAGPEYIFLEGSFTLAGETHCMSTTVDLTAESAPLQASFWYYMFGDNIGDLIINVNGTQEFIVSGQQQTGQFDPWLQGTFSLDAYAGGLATIQICMTEGNGAISTFESDTSIDHFQIFRCVTAPIISCPMDIMVNNDAGQCSAVVNFGNASAVDPDGGPVTITQTMGPPSGSAFPVGDTIIEFTATDQDGDSSTCQFTITVVDNEPPTQFDCPADITVDNDPGICGAVVDYPDPILMDNCFSGGGIVTDELSTIFGSNNGGSDGGAVYFDITVGPQNIMITELDINIAGTGAPFSMDVYTLVGSSVGNETNAAAWGAPVAVGSGTGNPEDTPSVAVLDNPVTLNANTTYGIALVMDASHGHEYTNGNGSNENFSNADLSIALGQATNVPFTGSVFSPRIWNGTVRYEINTSSVMYTVVTGFPSGDVFPVGTTLTTLEYTDAGGNTVQCTFNVTVNDIEAPTITCLGAPGTYDQTITITNPALMSTNTFSFTGTPVGAAGDATLEVRTFGDIDGTGGNEEAWTITDEDSNTTGMIGATGVFADQCNTTLLETFTIPAAMIDAWAADGMIDFTGTDVAGNINLTLCGGDFLELRLIYSTAGGTPVDVVLDANGMASIPVSSLVASTSDNCGPVTVTASGGAPVPATLNTGFAGGNRSFGNFFDINALNDATVQSFDINSENGAGINLELEIYAKSGTWVGNETNAAAWTLLTTTTVTTNAVNTPTPLNLTLNYVMAAGETHAFYIRPTDPTGVGGLEYTNGTGVGNVWASDANIEFLEGGAKDSFTAGGLFQPRVFNGNIHYNAGGAPSTTIDFTCDDVGENFIEVFATDPSGNESSCIATVNVIDDTDPILVCQDVTIELGADGTAMVDPQAFVDVANTIEACGLAVLATDVTDVSCDDIGTPITVTLFVADPSGNLASCTATLTVVDLLGPDVTCPADQTVDPGPGNLFYTVPDYFATGEATALDNCTDPVTVFSQDPAAGSQIPDGVYNVQVCATDEYGNENCCTFELTVESILGNEDSELSNAIVMYPNPAQNEVRISNGSNLLLNNAQIYDVNGKLISTIDLRDMQQEKVIDISGLSSGVYVVQITGENSSVVKRLIKE